MSTDDIITYSDSASIVSDLRVSVSMTSLVLDLTKEAVEDFFSVIIHNHM